MAAFATELLNGFKSRDVLEKAFKHIIESSDFDRIWLIKQDAEWPADRFQLMAEASSDGIESMADALKQNLENMHHFSSWRKQLHEGKVINVSLDQVDADKRKVIEKFGSKSVLLIPIVVDDNYYGVLGMASVSRPVILEKEERSIISTVARIVEVYLSRSEAIGRVLGYQDKLRFMAMGLEMTEQQERARIASGIHDDVLGALSFLKIKVSYLQKTQASLNLKGDLAEMADTITDMNEKLRHFIFDLSNPILEISGLGPAVKDLLKKVASEHNVKTSINDDKSGKSLNSNQKTFLYKTINELIVNIIKYAEANSIIVSIETNDNDITISVADDGVGFDTSDEERLRYDRNHGFGLFSIKERLESFGGSMKIHSKIGRGTKVTMKMPMTQEEKVVF